MKFAFVDTYSFPFLLKELEKVAITSTQRVILNKQEDQNILEKADFWKTLNL